MPAEAGEGNAAVSRPSIFSSVDLSWLFCALVLAAFLRFHNYTLAPLSVDNRDELTWSWSGLTLITRHVPYAWTNFHSYPDWFLLRLPEGVYKVVHPYFDDPPLFSLLVGGFAWLRGARELVDITPDMIRPVPIVLSLITVWQVYLLAYRLGQEWAARLGAMLLAVAPGAVLMGRQVEAEALIAPLFLGALLLTHRLLRLHGGRRTVAGILLCCYLAPLAKFSGFAVPAAVAALLLIGGRWRLALAAVGAAAASLLTFAVYGAAYDWNLFLAVIQEQSERRHGLMAGYEFIFSPAGLGRHLRDGWWALGWLGIAFLMARGRGVRDDLESFVVWPTMLYAAVIFLFTDETHVPVYGWYRISAYPLLYLAAGFLIWRAIRDLSPPGLLALLMLGGATSVSVLSGDVWVPPALLVAAIGIVVVGPALAARTPHANVRIRQGAQIVAWTTVGALLLAAAVESFILEFVYYLM